MHPCVGVREHGKMCEAQVRLLRCRRGLHEVPSHSDVQQCAKILCCVSRQRQASRDTSVIKMRIPSSPGTQQGHCMSRHGRQSIPALL